MRANAAAMYPDVTPSHEGTEPMAPVAEVPVHRAPEVMAPVHAPEIMAPVLAPAPVEAPAQVHVPEPEVLVAPVAAPAPVVVAPAPIKPRQVEIPLVAMSVPADSGLVLIETSHKAPPPMVNDDAPVRPRRVRPPKVEVASEPLEIVETQKGPSA